MIFKGPFQPKKFCDSVSNSLNKQKALSRRSPLVFKMRYVVEYVWEGFGASVLPSTQFQWGGEHL